MPYPYENVHFQNKDANEQFHLISAVCGKIVSLLVKCLCVILSHCFDKRNLYMNNSFLSLDNDNA